MAKAQDWYGKWLDRGMGHHLEIGVQIFLTLEGQPIQRIVEYFGGAGMQTRTLQKLFHPALHVVFDQHPDACATLRGLGLPLDVRQEEFIQVVEHDFQPDLAVLDFPDLGWRGAQEKYRAPLSRVFARGTPHIILTDTAGVRFPLHQKTTYAKMLGTQAPSFDDYLRGMSRWLYSEFGYSMRDCFHGGFQGSLRPGETMFTLRPGWEEPRIYPRD